MLYVRTVEGKGRGVFARRLIRQGEVLEQSPVIVLSAKEWESIERTSLFNYCYGWGEEMALALGMGSLFNHSYQPNALYTRHFDQQIIEYTARCDIQPDEEITINYNCDPNDMDPLWFAVR